MVLFLDKKEQVLEFELTPFGKHLFSVGKLNPKYYSFYDDDIMYDFNYQTGTATPLALETQNSIVTRINETPRMRSVTNFTEFLTNNSIGEVSVGLLSDEFDQQMLENSNGIGPLKTDGNTQTRGKPIYMQKFQSPIGSNDVFKNFAPSWKVRSISGSKQFSDGYEYIFGQIPKLSASLDLGYATTTVQSYDADSDSYVPRESYDLVKNDRLLLDIQELNSTFKQDENFDIEVFEIQDGTTINGQRMFKKYFENKNNQIVDGYMVSSNESENFDDPSADSVEKLFNILIDSDVGSFTACKLAEQFNKQSFLIDLDFDCTREIDDDLFYDIYGSETEAEICQT